MALNAGIRKCIRKSEGAILVVKLEEDKEFTIQTPEEVLECLNDDPESLEYFNSLAKSHRDYFIKWINSAKTESTRASRIVQMINAMAQKMDYSQMIRANRKIKNL
ncbi:YdeI/OmpD-associated family protein [Pedobacter sp. P351]|uniref:YdeI/OmpD-associated family protein n=1 Tax=Pedobacter superstes TaxID=3133441 RepID=UPI0030ADCC87